jgi:hypothetical protein
MDGEPGLLAATIGAWRAGCGEVGAFFRAADVFGASNVARMTMENISGRWPDALRVQRIRDARAAFEGGDP